MSIPARNPAHAQGWLHMWAFVRIPFSQDATLNDLNEGREITTLSERQVLLRAVGATRSPLYGTLFQGGIRRCSR
jgi:hypothetical protein